MIAELRVACGGGTDLSQALRSQLGRSMPRGRGAAAARISRRHSAPPPARGLGLGTRAPSRAAASAWRAVRTAHGTFAGRAPPPAFPSTCRIRGRASAILSWDPPSALQAAPPPACAEPPSSWRRTAHPLPRPPGRIRCRATCTGPWRLPAPSAVLSRHMRGQPAPVPCIPLFFVKRPELSDAYVRGKLIPFHYVRVLYLTTLVKFLLFWSKIFAYLDR